MEIKNTTKVLVGHHHIICSSTNLVTAYRFTTKHDGTDWAIKV